MLIDGAIDPRSASRRPLLATIAANHASAMNEGLMERNAEERLEAREAWKRRITASSNGAINANYGCDIWSELIYSTTQHAYPWSA
jgi:hypothetical protein